MNFFFEYVYYRTTQLFLKRDGPNGFTGICLMSMIQTGLVVVIPNEIGNLFLSPEISAQYAKQFGYLAGGIAGLLIFYNYKKHNGKYNEYNSWWEDETNQTRTLKGLLVALVYITPIILIIVLNIERNIFRNG